MRYDAYETLVAPARPSAQLWRLGLGIVLIIACFLVLGFSYFNLLAELVTQAEWSRSWHKRSTSGSTPRGMFVILGYFGLLTLVARCWSSINCTASQMRTLDRPAAQGTGPISCA